MKIDVYSVVWNEEFIMPYFLRHYTKFADVYLINNGCTDKTLEIAEGKATILDFPFHEINEETHSLTFEMAYKGSRGRADLVMCVDADEFVFPEKLDADLIKVTSYMMIAKQPPTTTGQIYEEIKTGVRMRTFDKPIVLNPYLDVKFGPGRHTANVEATKTGTRMFHYKYLGKEYYLERAKLVYPRKPRPKGEIEYRLKKGLKWYDKNINAKEVI